jgi:hypothetical protein
MGGGDMLKKFLPYVLLFTVVFFLVFVSPFAQGRASAGALPLVPQQVLLEGAEMAGTAILRAEGYKIVESAVARKTVLSMYSRLSPEGKAFFDTAVQTATKANKAPAWLKLILPTALMAEVGSIMTGLMGDSASGVADDYNDRSAPVSVNLVTGMSPTTVIDNIDVTSIGTFSSVAQSTYWILKESITGKSDSYLAGQPHITKISVDDASNGNFTLTVSFWYMSGANKMNTVFLITDSLANISNIISSLAGAVITGSAVLTDLSSDTDAITGPENTPSAPVEVAYPDKDVMTYDDFNTQAQADKSFVQDVPNPDVEPDAKPADGSSDWWKWLLLPLEKLLELLQNLFDWLKADWATLSGWWSSLLSKLADLLGAWSTWFGQLFEKLGNWFQTTFDNFAELMSNLGDWFQTLWDNFADLMTSLGDWFQTLWDNFANLMTSLGEWFQTLWDWLSNIANDIMGLPKTILDGITELFIPGDPTEVPDMFMSVKDSVADKFNKPDDFTFLKPLWSSSDCPPDIYASLMGQNLKVVDLQLVCSKSSWWKPIMTGFMWFLFGWWLFRKANALMAKNGGIK